MVLLRILIMFYKILYMLAIFVFLGIGTFGMLYLVITGSGFEDDEDTKEHFGE